MHSTSSPLPLLQSLQRYRLFLILKFIDGFRVIDLMTYDYHVGYNLDRR